MKILPGLFCLVLSIQVAVAQKSTAPAAASASEKTAALFNKDNTYVPGDSVLLIDYFDQEKLGTSPIKWRTAFATPVVEIAGSRWFKLLNNGEYAPKIMRTFPEKYTLEFNIVADGAPNEMGYVGNLIFTLGETMDDMFTNTPEKVEITTEVFVQKELTNVYYNNSIATTSGFAQTDAFSKKRGQKIHVAFAVDNKRMRMWVDNEKLFDDTVLAYHDQFNIFRIGLGAWNEKDPSSKVLMSDFRYAAGPYNATERLANGGSFSTAGISFVPGTAQITPASAGALARMASIINESTDARFRIISHADADVKDAPAITKQRAEAIKKALVTDYKVEAAKLETEGKGAEVQYARGRTLEAKTNNNRVEFLKLYRQ